MFEIRRTCQRTRSEKTDRGSQELLVKFESQVAQGLADLERLLAEARVTPVATARPEEDAGNNIEELAALRREVDQLRRERAHHNQ